MQYLTRTYTVPYQVVIGADTLILFLRTVPTRRGEILYVPLLVPVMVPGKSTYRCHRTYIRTPPRPGEE
jgi:hypothetical protein